MATYTRYGYKFIDEGDTMPGTARLYPIVATAHLLLHDGYVPVVDDPSTGTSGFEERDGQRVYVRYTPPVTLTAASADTDAADQLDGELITLQLSDASSEA